METQPKNINIAISQQVIKKKQSTQQLYLKSKGLLFVIACITSFGSFVIGYEMVCITMLERQIKQVNNLNDQNVRFYLSLINCLLPIGAIIGGYLIKMVQFLGQNKIMLYTDYIFIISCLISSHSLKIGHQCFSRFLFGITCGLSSSIIPSYLISISPISWSGFIASFHQIMIAMGIAFSYLIGQKHEFITIGNYSTWKVFMMIPIVYSITRVVILHIFKFDRLDRHYNEGNHDKLKQYMRIFYNKVKVAELIKLKGLIKQIKHDQQQQNNQSTLFGLPQKAFYVGLAVLVLNQLTSVSSIQFYAKQLFMNITNYDQSSSNRYLLLIGLVQIISSVIGGWLCFKHQRKYIIIHGGYIVTGILFVGFVSFLFQNGSYNTLPLIISILIIVYSISIGTITFVYLAQTFEDVYVYTIVYWFLSLFSTLFFQFINAYFGTKMIFFFGGIFCISSVIYLKDNMIQSKDKTYRQVMNEYHSGDKDEGTIRDYKPVDYSLQHNTELQ